MKEKLGLYFYFNGKITFCISKDKQRQATWYNSFKIALQDLCEHPSVAQFSPYSQALKNLLAHVNQETWRSIDCIFIIAKTLEITQGPSTGKWLHSEIKYRSDSYRTCSDMHVTTWMSSRNITLRRNIRCCETAQNNTILQSAKIKTKVSSRDTCGKIKFTF